MKKLLIVFLVFMMVIFFVGLYRTWFVLRSPLEKVFISGSIPDPKPDGFYSGSITGYHGSWQGKTFNASDNTGSNIFIENRNKVNRYYFTIYEGTGIQDRSTAVLKIDYNNEQNPFWARIILDEIVQIQPGHYLGKLSILLIPGLPFTLGYFRLQK